MVSYDVERILSALRSVFVSCVGYDSQTECPVLDVFEQFYEHIKEENDAEVIHSLGLVIPKTKCKGCDRQKGTLQFENF